MSPELINHILTLAEQYQKRAVQSEDLLLKIAMKPWYQRIFLRDKILSHLKANDAISKYIL